MGFDLSNYETVESRLARFWEQHPNGRIETTMMSYDGDSCVFRAEIYKENNLLRGPMVSRNGDELLSYPKPDATGYAHEIHAERGVNQTSFVENCETSAIGRALANMGFATQGKRASREEMQKVERLGGTPQPTGKTHTPSGAFATPKQIGYIKKLAKDKGMDDLALLEMIQLNLDDDSAVLELLKSHEASRIIEVLK
jgi:hypothetical protein